MAKHRKYDWPQLFADFEQSGLSQVDFCKQHALNAKYFSLKLSHHKTEVASHDSAFTRVSFVPKAVVEDDLIIEVGRCKVYCPRTLPTESIANLVHALA